MKKTTIREDLDNAISIRSGEVECLKAFDNGDLVPVDEREMFCLETGKWSVEGVCPIHGNDQCLVTPEDVPHIINWITIDNKEKTT